MDNKQERLQMTNVDQILYDIFLTQAAYDAAIIPIAYDNLKHDMNRILVNLSPEESRIIRRKYRKIWRNLIRKNICQNSNDLILSSAIAHKAGLGKTNPDAQNFLTRKQIVFRELNVRARKRSGI